MLPGRGTGWPWQVRTGVTQGKEHDGVTSAASKSFSHAGCLRAHHCLFSPRYCPRTGLLLIPFHTCNQVTPLLPLSSVPNSPNLK